MLFNFSELLVAHSSVRWRGFTDLLSKCIAISGYLKAGIISPFLLCSRQGPLSTYWATASFVKCIQRWGDLQSILAQTVLEYLVSKTDHWVKWLPSYQKHFFSSANSIFELMWLRKTCWSQEPKGQWEIQKGNPGYQREGSRHLRGCTTCQRCHKFISHLIPHTISH